MSVVILLQAGIDVLTNNNIVTRSVIRDTLAIASLQSRSQLSVLGQASTKYREPTSRKHMTFRNNVNHLSRPFFIENSQSPSLEKKTTLSHEELGIRKRSVQYLWRSWNIVCCLSSKIRTNYFSLKWSSNHRILTAPWCLAFIYAAQWKLHLDYPAGSFGNQWKSSGIDSTPCIRSLSRLFRSIACDQYRYSAVTVV